PATAFVVDLGVMQWQRSRAQRAADSAAIASVREYIKKTNNDTDYTFASRAKDVAKSFANQNGSDASTIIGVSSYEYRITGPTDTITIKNGRYDVATQTFFPSITPLNAIEVSISRVVPLYFARIFGITNSSVAVTAIARIGRAVQGTYPGVLPIGVPDSEYDPTNLYAMKGINWGSTAPGYKGLLNFDRRWWHCAFYNAADSKWYSLYNYDGDSKITAQVDYTGDGIYDSPTCDGSSFPYLDIDRDGTQDYKDPDHSSISALTQIVDSTEDKDDLHRGVTVVDIGSTSPTTWEDYIMNGYSGGVAVKSNQRVDIVTGNHSGPFCADMDYYVTNHGDTAIVPLIDDYVEQGTNIAIRIVRFAVFKVASCNGHGVTPDYNGEFVQTVVNAEIDDSANQSQSDADIFAVKLAK
ncbi:hypothetical protein M1146_04715, partial [Patescibacteria group bacterium]|nr:hypothetical protein [Patescibacteria group bacterium]